MLLMIRTNEQGMKDYYDWDMEDHETVRIHVNEITTNSRGKWFIKADYNGEKFYANISPSDAQYLHNGGYYDMTCTGHSGTFKYLSFDEVTSWPDTGKPLYSGKQVQPVDEGAQSAKVQTTLPVSTTSDQECDDYLFQKKEQLEKEKYRVDSELGVINKLIMKTC